MTNLSKNLIEETKDLLTKIKRNYLAIAVNVYKLKTEREWGDDEWVTFYRDELELQKSQVSKFLKVGQFVLEQGLLKETVGYEQLYLSIARNKDKSPEYILAEAQTWSHDDYKAQKKDDCKKHEAILVCKHCWKVMSPDELPVS